MIQKYLFRDDLCQLLSIDTRKKYSLSEIEKHITTANLKKATSLYLNYKGVCSCGHCILSKTNLLNIIKEYLIINESKPSCYFFEINQKPVEIINL